MRWTCDTSNITWRSKSSNDAWKCLKSALDLSDRPVMHSRLTDLPPKTLDSQTSSDGTVERSGMWTALVVLQLRLVSGWWLQKGDQRRRIGSQGSGRTLFFYHQQHFYVSVISLSEMLQYQYAKGGSKLCGRKIITILTENKIIRGAKS